MQLVVVAGGGDSGGEGGLALDLVWFGRLLVVRI
jgi:hypothetical protein